MCTSFRIAAVSAFSRALEGLFQEELQLPYFLGGSRRFGYLRPESDADFFVLAKDEEIEKDLVDFLASLGFGEQPNDLGYPLRPGSRLFALPKVFHVVIIKDDAEYACLEKQHETVARLVSDRTDLCELARLLRDQNVKGTHIFRAFLHLAHLTQAG